MKTLKTLLIATAVIIFGGPGMAAALQTGEAAPNFSLTDTYGDTHSLSNYQGKFVILEWINHDCPFVRKHYVSGNMQSLQRFASENDVVWLSIASSAPGLQGNYPADEWNEMTQDKGANPTAVLLDESGVVGRAYNAKTTPHMYIINPEGTLIYQGAIDDRPSTDPEDIPGSLNYVQKGLKEAFAGKSISEDTTTAYGCSVKYAG